MKRHESALKSRALLRAGLLRLTPEFSHLKLREK
jgi:hypothetical protein